MDLELRDQIVRNCLERHRDRITHAVAGYLSESFTETDFIATLKGVYAEEKCRALREECTHETGSEHGEGPEQTKDKCQ